MQKLMKTSNFSHKLSFSCSCMSLCDVEQYAERAFKRNQVGELSTQVYG